MIVVLLIAQILAFWPFESTLVAEISHKIVQATIKELEPNDEEALLLTKAYLEANVKISMESLVNDFLEQRFSGLFMNGELACLKIMIQMKLQTFYTCGKSSFYF